MGRAGRGGGGGGSRGGGFGGSRGFGSHSGSSFHSSSSHSSWSSSSHRSSRSSSHRSSSGSSFATGYVIGSMVSGSNPRRRTVTSASGSNKTGLIIFIIVFALYIFAEVLSTGVSGGIQRSTVEREKLRSSSMVERSDYFEDHLDWIKSDKTLEDGMEYFYEQTGVQPYLVITDNIGGNGTYSDQQMKKFANDVYDANFSDEAHLVLVFYEKFGEYHSFYLTGVEAKTVVDDEGGEILLDYVDHFYYSDLDEDEMFARAFRESADRMMTVTPRYGWMALIIVLIIIVLIVCLTWWSKRKKAKLAEMNKAQQILDQDLNAFGGADYNTAAGATVTNPTPPPDISGSAEVDELKKKYDNMDNGLM